VADYDRERIVPAMRANANDVIAGSTATMAVLSVSEDGADELVLNCGDSRTLAIGKPRGGVIKRLCSLLLNKRSFPELWT